MIFDNKAQGRELVRWSAIAFVVAGIGRLASMATFHADQIAGISVPEWTTATFTVVGFGVAMAGLAGLYPLVVDRSPRLARVGAIGVIVVVLSLVGAAIGKYVIGGDGTGAFGLLVSLSFYVFTTLSFVLFGLAGRRTPELPRTVGTLLLVVAASRLVTVAGGVAGVVWVGQIGTFLYALPLLAVAYRLRTESIPAERDEPRTTATTR